MEKPLDKKLEDAACRYYDVQLDFFRIKGEKGENTNKRWILFCLLYEDAGLDYSAIAHRYGFKRGSIKEAIDNILFRARMFMAISRDMDNIREMSRVPLDHMSEEVANVVQPVLTDKELLVNEMKGLEARGWSLRKIGKKCGVSHMSVKRYLKGESGCGERGAVGR